MRSAHMRWLWLRPAARCCSIAQSGLDAREALAQARELRRLLPGITLIMNDRADLCLAAGFDGVHVGQEDLSPEGCAQRGGRRDESSVFPRTTPRRWPRH